HSHGAYHFACLTQPRQLIRYQDGFNPGTTSIKQWHVCDASSICLRFFTTSTAHIDKERHYIIKYDDTRVIRSQYQVVRLLCQWAYGKVVEVLDMAHPLYSANGIHTRASNNHASNASHMAIKVTRAVPKCHDASKIENRVLKCLKQSDPQNTRYIFLASVSASRKFIPFNRNCIHYLGKSEHRNHICIVTQLLSQRLHDFPEENQSTPYPRRHSRFRPKLVRQRCLPAINTDLHPENILLVDSADDSCPCYLKWSIETYSLVYCYPPDRFWISHILRQMSLVCTRCVSVGPSPGMRSQLGVSLSQPALEEPVGRLLQR
ncbi:unnamed protein product, partial [Rhizoctonia solani]